MPIYRDKNASGQEGELTVIEDTSMTVTDEKGNKLPIFRFIDDYTIRAHPIIISILLQDAEPVWGMEELLAELEE